jgi:hypothetical protein
MKAVLTAVLTAVHTFPVLRKVHNLSGTHTVLGRETIHPFIAPQGANVKLLLSDCLTASVNTKLGHQPFSKSKVY